MMFTLNKHEDSTTNLKRELEKHEITNNGSKFQRLIGSSKKRWSRGTRAEEDGKWKEERNLAHHNCHPAACISCCMGQPKRYRHFIDESYPLKNQLTDINNIFTQFESEIDSQQTLSAFSNNLQNLNLNKIRFPTEVSVPSSENNLIV